MNAQARRLVRLYLRMRWQTVDDCNFCGSRRAKPFLAIDTANWYDQRALELSECVDCRLVRATPRPDREDLYRNYMIGTPHVAALVKKRLLRPNVLAFHRRAIEDAVKLAKRPVRALFDMGCGAGTVLMAAKTLGISGIGNDVNKVAVMMLNELGFDVRHGFTNTLDVEGLKVDVVMSLEYIEQSYEPFDDLKRSHALLNSGGILYVRTLYLECPEHRASGDAWPMFGVGHFYHFHADTLRAMIEAAGFHILDVRLTGMATIIATREN